MDGMDQQKFERIFELYKQFTSEIMDSWSLANHIIKKIRKKGTAQELTEVEREYLLFLLNHSVRLQQYTLDVQGHRKKINSAEQILLKSGSNPVSMNKALAVFGLRIKSLKKSRYSKMKTLYNFLYDDPGNSYEQDCFSSTLDYNGKKFEIKWTAPRGKKIAIIDVIREILGAKTRNAVIAQLRLCGTENLPSLEGSGHYRADQRPGK
jgi:hypothetical protein